MALAAVLLIATFHTSSFIVAKQISVKLSNNAGAPIDVYWMDQSPEKKVVRMLKEPLPSTYSTEVATSNEGDIMHMFAIIYTRLQPLCRL